jgi:hypothetical protein
MEDTGKGQEATVSMPGFLVADKVTIVTGSRRGIGKATALALAEAGSDVAVCDLVADDGQLRSISTSGPDRGNRRSYRRDPILGVRRFQVRDGTHHSRRWWSIGIRPRSKGRLQNDVGRRA